jgi:hypothetical protein
MTYLSFKVFEGKYFSQLRESIVSVDGSSAVATGGGPDISSDDSVEDDDEDGDDDDVDKEDAEEEEEEGELKNTGGSDGKSGPFVSGSEMNATGVATTTELVFENEAAMKNRKSKEYCIDYDDDDDENEFGEVIEKRKRKDKEAEQRKQIIVEAMQSNVVIEINVSANEKLHIIFFTGTEKGFILFYMYFFSYFTSRY